MKRGSDLVGVVMGLLTIPMALLTLAGVGAGVALAIHGDWPPLLTGLVALLAGALLAPLLERIVIAIDETAARSLDRGARRRAQAIAFASGALPVVVIFMAQIVCLRRVLAAAPDEATLGWLWGYAAAVGPWTLYAERVSRFRRTLVGIRAYFGHIALWLFTLAALVGNAPPIVVALALIAPAFVPVTVGLLLALADREAIANVRV